VTSTSNLLRTRFKLVTAMGNSGACDEALPLIVEGLEWIENIDTKLNDLEAKKKVKEFDANIDISTILSMKNTNLDNKAYLLVSKSRCSKNVASMGMAAYEAAMTRPQMAYAMEHAESVGKIVEQIKSSGMDPNNVFTSWEFEDDDDQTAKLSFKFKRV
jgi:hypothetical protein